MTLLSLCSQLAKQKDHILPAEHPMGPRLICPEYSQTAQEVKTYPLLASERLFLLLWDIQQSGTLHAALRPCPEPFVYHCSISDVERTQLHTHDYIELSYVVKGEFHQKILNQEIVFEEGDLCLIDKNCLHQDLLYPQDTIVLFLGIANDMFTEVMDENITEQKIIQFLQSAFLKQKSVQQYLHFRPKKENTPAMEESLTMLLQELSHPQIGSSQICRGLLMRIFRLLSTGYEFSLSQEQKQTMSWVIFEEVSDYISKHFVNISVSDLTDKFHFQEDYFNRLIKSKTGFTYSAYVQQFRLGKAAELLSSSDLSIEEIAEAVGYHNKGYFYKIFCDKYKMTPAQYRSQNITIS